MEVPLSGASGPSQKQAEKPSGVGGHRPFLRALAFARSLQLRCRSEWQAWCTGDTRPPDIPKQPEAVYADAGWQSYEHWLAPAFVKADYDRPKGGLEVQGKDGRWRAVTTYNHTTAGNVVLWYGSDEFAGIGGTLRWADAAREILRDAEGAMIKTRPKGLALRLSSPPEYTKPALTTDSPATAIKTTAATAATPNPKPAIFSAFATPSSSSLAFLKFAGDQSGGTIGKKRVSRTEAGRPTQKTTPDPKPMAKAKAGAAATVNPTPIAKAAAAATVGVDHRRSVGAATSSDGSRSAFVPFDAGVAFARALGMTTSEQWASWAKSGARTYPSSSQRVMG